MDTVLSRFRVAVRAPKRKCRYGPTDVVAWLFLNYGTSKRSVKFKEKIPLRMPLIQALARLVAPRRLDPNALREGAEKATGVSEPGVRPVSEPLEILCRASNNPGVTPLGRLHLKNVLSMRLEARLRIEDYLRKNPAVSRQEIPRPVIILGLPRTGSTVLHRLLAQDPAVRAPVTWEMEHVAPPPTSEDWNTHPARLRAERQNKIRKSLMKRANISIDQIHDTGPNLPEECNSLLANYLQSQLFATQLVSQEYASYLRSADSRAVYEAHRLQLQILQTPFPGRRWVLKAPFHLRQLPVLSSLYPDAVFVFIHRDPLEVVPSASSLVYTGRSTMYKEVDKHATAVEVSDILSGLLERGLKDRAELEKKSGVTIIDVFYPEIRRDPIAAARTIYRKMNIPFSENAEIRMQAWFASNRQHKHGKHSYSLQEFGLTAEAERRRFAAYYDSFGPQMQEAEKTFA